MSQDPEGGKAIDPATQHKYLYVGGNPTNRLDPSGRAEEGEYDLETEESIQQTEAFRYKLRAAFCIASLISVGHDIRNGELTSWSILGAVGAIFGCVDPLYD